MAGNDSANVDEDQSVLISVLDNDSDVDIAREGDTITISSVDGVDHGSYVISPDNTTITFTPDADWSGTEIFTYVVTDTHGATDTASVTVTVSPVDDDPDAQDDAYTIQEDAPLAIAVGQEQVHPPGQHMEYFDLALESDQRPERRLEVGVLWQIGMQGELFAASLSNDDGAIDAGAVWVLFLSTDGRVKDHQKISRTQGGVGLILKQLIISAYRWQMWVT